MSSALSGAGLRYEVHGGSGPWLTLIHGGLVSSRTWERQIADLVPYCRVLTYDLRGYGTSAPARPEETVANHAQDLLGLWDELGARESYVLGFSLGGMIAQEVALAAAERVLGLLLVSTAGRLDDAGRTGFRERAAAVESGAVESEIDIHVGRAFSLGFLESQPELVVAYVGEIARTEPATLGRTLLAVAGFDRLDDLGAVRCRTSILAGEHDDGMGVRYARELARRIPRSALTVVPGVGHTMHIEMPTTFNQLVAEFLTSTPEEASAV